MKSFSGPVALLVAALRDSTPPDTRGEPASRPTTWTRIARDYVRLSSLSA
jgi:hypothetical protein